MELGRSGHQAYAHLDRLCKSLDPVHRLPPELFVKCIPETGSYFGSYPKSLLDLTLVSQTWNNFALSASILWAEIHIDNSEPDLLATIATFIHLSAGRLLNLTLWDLPSPECLEWEAISSILSPIRHRIQRLLIGNSYLFKESQHTPWLPTIHRSIGQLPNLVELQITQMDWERGELQLLELPNGVKITSAISLSSTQTLFLNKDFTTKLTSMKTSLSVKDVAPMFSSLPNLHILSFEQSGPLESSTAETVDFTMPPPYLGEIECSLPHGIDVNMQRLIKLSCMKLTVLRLDVLMLQLPSIVGILQSLVRLQMLDLAISEWLENSVDLLHPEIPITRVASLKYLSIGAPEAHTMGPHDQALLRQMFTTFSFLYPCAISVDLENIGNIIYVAQPYLETLTSIEQLSLYGSTYYGSTGRQLYLPFLLSLYAGHPVVLTLLKAPNLLALHSSASMDEEPVSTLHFPHLEKLDINIFRGETFSLPSNEYGVPKIQELTIGFWGAIRQVDLTSLPYLSSITLKSAHFFCLGPQCNTLLVELIYRPEQCPALQEIRSGVYADWDILFIMLERRNYMKQGVKKIGTVTLPFVPFFLQASLSLLLKGLPTDRPPNTDLSISATQEAICDPSVPGCVACLMNMRPNCSKDIDASKSGIPIVERHMHMVVRYRDPPASAPILVRRWMERRHHIAEEWKSAMGTCPFSRVLDCKRRNGISG